MHSLCIIGSPLLLGDSSKEWKKELLVEMSTFSSPLIGGAGVGVKLKTVVLV